MSGIKKIVAPEYKVGEKVKRHANAVRTSMKESIYPSTATVFYPRERKKMPDNFRGLIRFNPEDCISCFNCSFVCPANAIMGEKAPNGRYYPSIDYAKCIFCHFCVDSCSTGALKPTKIHDVAYKDLDEMFTPAEKMVELPEIIREDKRYVEYVIDKDDLHLNRIRGKDTLFVETPPPKDIPMVSVCIEPESCLGCRICEEICEHDAISSTEYNERLRMEIDHDKCTGCGLCAKECSMQILRLVRKE